MDQPPPTCDEMRLSAEIRARFRPRDRSNAIPLSRAEHDALVADLIRRGGPLARALCTPSKA